MVNFFLMYQPSFTNNFVIIDSCLRTLDLTYAKYLIDPSQKLNMPGIDKVELFIGEAGSLTGWHIEDLNFVSVNYLQSGKPKFWVV